MKHNKKQSEASQFIQSIVLKAQGDRTFKSRLISKPEETIEKMTGKIFDSKNNAKLIVEDQMDNNNIYLNIPRKVNSDNMELTDKQLEMVAGGWVPVVIALAVIAYNGFKDGQKD